MATGQAAGVCAAFAARQGLTTRAASVAEVQDELTRQGANLRGIRPPPPSTQPPP